MRSRIKFRSTEEIKKKMHDLDHLKEFRNLFKGDTNYYQISRKTIFRKLMEIILNDKWGEKSDRLKILIGSHLASRPELYENAKNYLKAGGSCKEAKSFLDEMTKSLNHAGSEICFDTFIEGTEESQSLRHALADIISYLNWISENLANYIKLLERKT